MARNKRAWIYGWKGFDAAVLPEAKSHILEVIEDGRSDGSIPGYAYKIVDGVRQAYEVQLEVKLIRRPEEDTPDTQTEEE